MRLLLPLLLLCSCFPIISGTPPLWTTKCGLIMRGGIADGKEVQGFSQVAVEKITEMAIFYDLVTCDDLAGYQLMIHLEGAYDPGGYPKLVNGTTYCNFMMPRVEADIHFPTVLFHEFHHVAQRCDAPGPRDTDEDSAHADWTRSGARERIWTATENYLKVVQSGELGPGAVAVPVEPKDGG